MRIAERVDKLESAFVTHLEESGSIRTDLAWLKKAFWTLTAAMIAAVVSQFVRPGEYHAQQPIQSVSQVQQKP